MLQRIRDNASGPVAYVVVGLIALVFGVWGIGSYFTPSADPVVASVGSTDITQNQLQQAYNQRYAQLRGMMGEHFDPSRFPPSQLRRAVLHGMINDAVLEQYANQAGYRVTNGDVLAALQNDPQFQKHGKFSTQRYRALLAQAGIPAARYEAGLRKRIKSQAIRQEITGSAFATPKEVSQIYRLVDQQRKVQYLMFDPGSYKGQVQVSADEIKDYYDKHPKQFMRPQQVKLSYVSLDRKDVAGRTPPSSKMLHAIYAQNKASLGTPEKRSADAIKVPIAKGGDAAARKTVEAVMAATKNGKDLHAAAQAISGAQYEQIKASAKDDLPEAVGQALFALTKGQLSSPVKGSKAWYVLRLKSVTPAEIPMFDDPKVQARLHAIASAKQASEAFRKQSDKMDDLAYQAPNDLKTLADALHLKIQDSGWISRNSGSGIGQFKAVRKAAFSDSVLKDKLNSTVISLGNGHKVVLRVDGVKPAARKPLEAVQSQIHDRLVAQKETQKAEAAAQRVLKQLKTGTPMERLAKQNSNAALKTPGFIGRDADAVDPRVIDTAFSLPEPQDKKASYAITPTGDGAVALVAVDAVRAGDTGQGKKAKVRRQQFAQLQRSYVSELEYSALSDYLESQAGVVIHKKALQ